MTAPSNEVLDERFNNMKEQNASEHKALFKKVDWMDEKLDLLIERLEEKFVMRKEFKVAIWLLWAFATVIWIVWFFID